MAQTTVNFNQFIIEQTDLKSTYVDGTIKSGEGAVAVGTPVIGQGDPEKFVKMEDDSQQYRVGIVMDAVDATSADKSARILTGGGISIDSLVLTNIAITGQSVSAAVGGILKNNGIRVVETIDAIQKVAE